MHRPVRAAWERRDWQLFGLLAALAALVFLPGLGSYGILNSSDAYYSEGAREMVELGDYLTPHLNYQPWFEKPILNFWLIASAYNLLGVNEFASRLPSALSGAGMVLATFVFGRLFLRRRAALLAALVMLANPFLAVLSHVSLTDCPLTFFMTVSLFAVASALELRRSWLLWLGYAALGAAVLCKGPVAIALIGANVVAYLALTRSSVRDFFKSAFGMQPLLGLVLTLAVAAPWFVAVHLETGGDFTREFFIGQNIGRVAGHTVHNHAGQFWYYVPFVFGGFFPWSVFFVTMPRFVRRIWRSRRSLSKQSRFLFYNLVWVALVIGLFSALPTKLGTYVLPAFPGLAVLTGGYLDRALRSGKGRQIAWTAPLFPALGLAALIAVPFLRKLVPPSLLPVLLTVVALISIGFVAYWLLSRRARPAAAVYVLAALATAGCGFLVPLGMKAYYKINQQGFQQIVMKAKASGSPLAVLGANPAPAAFYLHKMVPGLYDQASLQAYRATFGRGAWLIVPEKVVARQSWLHQHLQMIEQRGKWCLFALE